jgi:hypothetical protein
MARVLALMALVAIAAPAALAADPVPADFKNAAKYCKAVRDSKGVEAFQTAYGTNKNKKNAFGKCVSQTAKAKAAKNGNAKKDDDDDDAAESKVTADCKKQQAADAARFAKDNKNFGQTVKAGNAKNGDDEDDD